jgi:hypothetical protein
VLKLRLVKESTGSLDARGLFHHGLNGSHRMFAATAPAMMHRGEQTQSDDENSCRAVSEVSPRSHVDEIHLPPCRDGAVAEEFWDRLRAVERLINRSGRCENACAVLVIECRIFWSRAQSTI